MSPHCGAARQVLVQGFAGTMGAAYVQYNLLDGVQVGLMQLRASIAANSLNRLKSS